MAFIKNKKDIEENLKIGLFSGDQTAIFLYKKTERIVQAMYLVTEFLDDLEPLKRGLREKGLNCISDVTLFLVHGNSEYASPLLQKASMSLVLLRSLGDLASESGLISSMNMGLIRDEIGYLIRSIEVYRGDQHAGTPFLLKRDFFETGNGVFANKARDKYKGQQNSSLNKNSVTKQSNLGQMDTVQEKSNVFESSRKQAIRNIIATRGEVSIKDIVGVIKDYSEKTIQRELLEMVQLGILEKKGERRWSRYTLKRSG